MGSNDNRKRGKWQDYSGANAGIAERNFLAVFQEHFSNSHFQIRSKPNEFSRVYVDAELPDELLGKIYTPPTPITRHGVFPDYAIDNLKSEKTLYVEVKRQDGWVDGGTRADGRGNAHERSCKFFTPGLLNILREQGGIAEPHLPFWTVFQGNITRDPCRVREITTWYGDFDAHFFFWHDPTNASELIQHFEKNLKRILR